MTDETGHVDLWVCLWRWGFGYCKAYGGWYSTRIEVRCLAFSLSIGDRA